MSETKPSNPLAADPARAAELADPEWRRLEAIGAFHGMIGRSPAMLAVYRKIALYGPAEAPVLILGETGTGKDLVARAIHARSRRGDKPFVALNCTALNEELFESELFGHEKGAFTGADRPHRGRFERADGGTLFLDEIGEMSLRVQAKMLRALEQGVIERVGAESERQVDVRVLAATNTSLDAAVQLRRFRPDLFHRISVFRVAVPPLRERPGDLAPLVQHFLRILNARYGRRVARLTPEALRFLEEYRWPGNVRELRNVLERVYVESGAEVIGRNDFAEWERERETLAAGDWNLHLLEQQRLTGPIFVVPAGMPPAAAMRALANAPDAALAAAIGPLPEDPAAYPLAPPGFVLPRLQDSHPPSPAARSIDVAYTVESRGAPRARGPLTEEAIRQAFDRSRGNATRAAALLGCHKTTLYRNMKRLGLSRQDLEKQPE